MSNRKPISSKQLAGTIRADRDSIESEANLPIPLSLPNAPKHLNKWGKTAWKYYGNMLIDAGMLTNGDFMALEMLCHAYGRWVETEMKVEELGTVLQSSTTGGLYQNPYLGVANRAYDHLLKLMGSFGLNPAERNRVSSVGANNTNNIMNLLLTGYESNDSESEG